MYGLTELARDEVRNARLVANPGCYPTAAQLPLIALLKAGLILADDIIIDAKSGTTGAGRAPKQGTLFCEVRGVWGAAPRYPSGGVEGGKGGRRVPRADHFVTGNTKPRVMSPCIRQGHPRVRVCLKGSVCIASQTYSVRMASSAVLLSSWLLCIDKTMQELFVGSYKRVSRPCRNILRIVSGISRVG